MSRTIGGNPVTDDRGTSVYLVRLNYWDGAVQQEVRFTDAPVDLDVNVGVGTETWVGTGLLMNISAVAEGADLDISGVDIIFDGVDQTVISIILGNQFRGQPVEIFKAWFDSDDATIAGTPILLFKGYQNDPYSVGETSTDLPDAVSVSTRAISLLTRTMAENVVLSNPASHLNMLERGGLSDTTADFWVYVPQIAGVDIYWGERGPNIGPPPVGPPEPDPDDEREDPWYN